MLKPFYNRKVNIDDRLVPAVTAEDAGKALVVGEDGKITTGDAGGKNIYKHTVVSDLAHTTGFLVGNYVVEFLSDKSTAYTLNELKSELQAGGYTINNPYIIPPTMLYETYSSNQLYMCQAYGLYYNSVYGGNIGLAVTSNLFTFTIEDSAVKITNSSNVAEYPAVRSLDKYFITLWDNEI